MVAAAHTPCQGGRFLIEKGPRLSGQSQYNWVWPEHSYWMVTHSGKDGKEKPTTVAGKKFLGDSLVPPPLARATLKFQNLTEHLLMF